MALYVSEAKRLRRVVVVAATVGVVALAIGWAIGRQQIASIDERVREVQTEGARVASAVERLDIEYEQVLSGNGDSIAQGVIAPLAEVRAILQKTLDRAPWVTVQQRAAILDALAQVDSDANAKVDADAFRAALKNASTLIRTTMGATA